MFDKVNTARNGPPLTKDELNRLFTDAGYDSVMVQENPKHEWVCAAGCKP